jgi:cell volume regulation protein A
MVKELGLPREGLVNVIVRDGEAIPPRGSTEIEADDELHVLVRAEARERTSELVERWQRGPVGEPELPRVHLRGAPAVFSVWPTTETDGEIASPRTVSGVEVVRQLRTRRDHPGALVALSDGRFAITGAQVSAIGGRRQLARWAIERAERLDTEPQERSWWQEVVGVLNAPALR